METTIAVYDISGKHDAFKRELLDLDYQEGYGYEKIKFTLPDTTVLHFNKSAKQVREEFLLIANQLGVELLRFYAQGPKDWAGIEGKPFKEK